MKDIIVEEIRAYREAYAARFNFDLDAIFRDIQEKQEQAKREGFRFTNFDPKRTDAGVVEPEAAGDNRP